MESVDVFLLGIWKRRFLDRLVELEAAALSGSLRLSFFLKLHLDSLLSLFSDLSLNLNQDVAVFPPPADPAAVTFDPPPPPPALLVLVCIPSRVDAVISALLPSEPSLRARLLPRVSLRLKRYFTYHILAKSHLGAKRDFEIGTIHK